MPAGTTDAHETVDSKGFSDTIRPIGNWEVHSWGDGEFPGMAAVSAITTLQVGATLTTVPADKIALNKAAEYLMDALAPQLKSFQRALSAE
jgi:hypothetical protein